MRQCSERLACLPASSSIFRPVSAPPGGVKRDQHHALRDVILLVVCAVANGADGSEMIEELGREKLDLVGDFVSFANSVHSQDCIAQAV